MEGFGPQRVAHFRLITVRVQKDAKHLRDRAASQLRLNQLVPEDLHRLKFGRKTENGIVALLFGV